MGIYRKCVQIFGKKLKWKDIILRMTNGEAVFFYAGDIPDSEYYSRYDYVGLSLKRADKRHIRFDVTEKYPIPNDTIDAYQAEDVFEHIPYQYLVDAINEIYRILKPGGYFRLSVPDYRFDEYANRVQRDGQGKIIFDPDGGGDYCDGNVINGGHVWFPTFESVNDLVLRSKFSNYEFYHYYTKGGESVTKEIDYSKGYIQRTPDHDKRSANPYRAMSIVVDMYKE